MLSVGVGVVRVVLAGMDFCLRCSLFCRLQVVVQHRRNERKAEKMVGVFVQFNLLRYLHSPYRYLMRIQVMLHVQALVQVPTNCLHCYLLVPMNCGQPLA
jgi:hypothetical protein